MSECKTGGEITVPDISWEEAKLRLAEYPISSNVVLPAIQAADKKISQWKKAKEQVEKQLIKLSVECADIRLSADKEIATKDAELARLWEENRKLKSMCKAAAAEISEHWGAHCDAEGYGPSNLMSRLEGRIKPDLYPGFDDEALKSNDS